MHNWNVNLNLFYPKFMCLLLYHTISDTSWHYRRVSITVTFLSFIGGILVRVKNTSDNYGKSYLSWVAVRLGVSGWQVASHIII